MRCSRISADGFTLIELSIVLVIIGLLVGGILVGGELVEHSQMSKAHSDLVRYETAMNSFKAKYDAIPGDMINATTYFPASASCTFSTVSTTQTCNGDGDGQIEISNGVLREIYLFWQHLSFADMIEGKYVIAQSTPDPRGKGGYNLPAITWQDASLSIVVGYAGYLPADNKHYFVMGKVVRTASGSYEWPWDNMIPSPAAYAFDTKYDDGKRNSGRLQGNNIGYAPFSTNACGSGSAYSTSTANGCYISYDLKF